MWKGIKGIIFIQKAIKIQPKCFKIDNNLMNDSKKKKKCRWIQHFLWNNSQKHWQKIPHSKKQFHHRPISLLSSINKIIEKTMYSRWYKFLDKFNWYCLRWKFKWNGIWYCQSIHQSIYIFLKKAGLHKTFKIIYNTKLQIIISYIHCVRCF